MTGAEQVADNAVVQLGARLGYVVSGVLHLLIGVLAVQLASGNRSAEADRSGALQTMAASPFGGVLLVGAGIALGLLAVWQSAMALARGPVTERLAAGGKAVGYLVLAVAPFSILLGLDQSTEQRSRSAAATVLTLPWGAPLLVVVGLVILGIGVYHVVKGVRRGFRHDLTQEPPRGIIALGVIGFVAKGVALATVGGLFVQAALTDDPDRAGGVDGALTALLQLPQGPVVVGVVGAGFAAYGLYSFVRARWPRN